MFATTIDKMFSMKRLLAVGLVAAGAALAHHAQAAAPGITGPTFDLAASPAFITQPDGQAIYSWGYGCNTAPAGFKPAAITATFCNVMQIPGPTLIVTEGDTVTVTLHNNLPAAAGNTSILFPGFTVATSGGTPGLLTQEAAPGGTVTYTFTAGSPGTRAYYSGTQGDLQVEMGLYGAIIVLPKNVPGNCTAGLPATNPGANATAKATWGESDFRLAASAFDNSNTCYDREYLFQFSEMDPAIHYAALAQVQAGATSLHVPTEPYHPAYYMINGRSMPDDMDPNYTPQYPNQPYNGNPHMHPGEVTLLRIIGQGRWQHPFHEHANHVRILARDGNMLTSTDGTSLAGPLLFTTTTTPGQAMDGLFYYTGKGLNWDMYGHNPGSNDPQATLPCTPDANGYNTGAPAAINYFEWCQDHNKPMQAAPFGDVVAGGPVTLPDPNIFTNGAWWGGSPYLGPDATERATFGTPGNGTTGTTPPSGTIANNPSSEAGFAFMWHSHNEREITTNNIFPGGMLMMMLVDSREFVIDESL
ncbi:MAG TPA: multicopper oxidase family protein [Steroidobacteraceae bacterium]|nr:multicopper oxidase family protein [Steroidobacteraceae bacterium]